MAAGEEHGGIVGAVQLGQGRGVGQTLRQVGFVPEVGIDRIAQVHAVLVDGGLTPLDGGDDGLVAGVFDLFQRVSEFGQPEAGGDPGVTFDGAAGDDAKDGFGHVLFLKMLGKRCVCLL